jgi:hypothetical protein
MTHTHTHTVVCVCGTGMKYTLEKGCSLFEKIHQFCDCRRYPFIPFEPVNVKDNEPLPFPVTKCYCYECYPFTVTKCYFSGAVCVSWILL